MLVVSEEIANSLARQWWPRCDRWARQMERRYRAAGDFGSVANTALYRTIQRIDTDTDIDEFSMALNCALRDLGAVVCNRILRRDRKFPRDYTPFDFDAMPADSLDIDPFVTGPILACVEQLPPRQQTAVRRVILDGERIVDVAREQGVSKQAIHDAIRLGLARLKSMLAEKVPE